MTETTTPERTPKAIVQEALDTIRMTYWIKGSEFEWAQGQYSGDVDKPYDFSNWESLEKAITIEVPKTEGVIDSFSARVNNGEAKMTGMCSIGALALADHTLYSDQLAQYTTMAGRDLCTFLAGVALAKVIWLKYEEHEEEGEWWWLRENPNSHADTIASWNDRDERTREEVIWAFEEALKDPLMTNFSAPVQLVLEHEVSGGYPPADTQLVFATEEEGRAWLDANIDSLRSWWFGTYRHPVFKPLYHDALVPA